jgi:RNA polymerase-binding transcription factor DksA
MEEPSAADPPAIDDPAALPSLEQLADDLAGVERALERLEDGSYWTDEVTGEPIPDDVLASDPAARRAPARHPDPPA